MIESDIGNIIDTDDSANASYIFIEPIATLIVEYMMGNDFTNPAQQRIGIGSPTFCAYDFGDAPSSYGSILSNGPRHTLGYRTLYMGANPPDGEDDGQPGAAATTDDTNQVGGIDDEDGVATFPNCPQTGSYTVVVNATNNSGSNGFLVGYIDWNRDGTFSQANERSTTVTVATGTNGADQNVTWSSVPSNCGGLGVTSASYARFRFTTSQTRAESPVDGAGLRAPDGEVEDYLIPAGTLPVTLAWVESSAGRNGLDVRWMTATEHQNGGFRIWGLDVSGARHLLGVESSKVVDSFAPQSYEGSYRSQGIVAIEIEDLGFDGKNRLHGPFTVGSTAGERPVAAEYDWAAIRAELAPAVASVARERAQSVATRLESGDSGGSSSTAALLKVRAEGIQRVTYEDLLAAGVDLAGTLSEQLSLVDQGRVVPRYVSSAGAFGPGAYVEFLAHPQLTLASPYDAFELRVDRLARQNPPTLGAGAGDPAVIATVDEHFPDHVYGSGSPSGDPWMDALLVAVTNPALAQRSFDLPDVATGAIELTVDLWGYSYFAGVAPDHRVIVRLNGNELTDETFDGLVTWSRTFDVTGVVTASGNVLEVEVPNGNPYGFDVIGFEGFSVSYPRMSVAREGRFQGRPVATKKGGRTVGSSGPSGTGSGYAVDGFAGPTVAAWLDSGGALSRGELVPAAGRVTIADSTAQAYLSDVGALHAPEIEAGAPAPLFASAAEYIILTHPAFVAGLDTLVSLQESRGLSTEVVPVDRVFAAYSDHAPSAEALRLFLAESASNLRYVLIAGADTSDPWDHLGLGSISFVPTAYLPVVSDVPFSPTDEAIADLDGDFFPDVPIGRLPVHTPAELANAIDKIFAWEANVVGAPDALLVAGASDGGRALADINEDYRTAIPSWPATLAQVDDLGTAAVRQMVIDGMNAGVPLVSWVGHSSPSSWDFTVVLRWQDVDAFTNVGRPNLVTQWGCWNSYYVEPQYQCMSGRMMNATDVGAAATIGASTLTSEASHRRLGELFFQRLQFGGLRLGDAFLAAKQALRDEGAPDDAIFGMMLLGDPAMPLPEFPDFVPPTK